MKFQWRKLTRKERGGSKWKYEIIKTVYTHSCILGKKGLRIQGNDGGIYALYSILLSIFPRYRWNGSNVVFDTKACMRASCVHDVGYQFMQSGQLDISYRDYLDQMYRDMCIEDGMWRWHANLRYWGLKHFAGKYAKAKNG